MLMIRLIIGGSGSGKSDYAEQLLKDSHKKIYLATMPHNDANYSRIERHIRRRADKGFVTIEKSRDFAQLEIPHGASVLLEDLPNLLANEMFLLNGTVNEDAYETVEADLNALMEHTDDLVIVTDDIFCSGMEYDIFTEKYMQILGELQAWIAGRGTVIEVIAGIAIGDSDEQRKI